MKRNLIFTGEIKGNKTEINLKLNLIQFKEKDIYAIYSPELDLYGYGKTVSEAKKSFEIALIEFIQYTQNKKTFFSEMKRLGWTIKKRKNKIDFKITVFSDIINKNNTAKEIINGNEYKHYRQNIPLAVSL